MGFAVIFSSLLFSESAHAQETDTVGCCVLAGDTTNDGEITMYDATYLLDFVFANFPPPDCMEQADINGNGAVTVSDVVYMVKYIFLSGPAPACPPPSP